MYEGRLVHLSERDLHGETLQPRIPKNFLVEHGYENNEIKRVSFAPSEREALIGMGMNLKGKELFVHEPADYTGAQFLKATVEDVPDAVFTNEVWGLSDVPLKRVGKIKVVEAEDDPLIYEYGPGHKAETYGWTYEPLNKQSSLAKLAYDYRKAER